MPKKSRVIPTSEACRSRRVVVVSGSALVSITGLFRVPTPVYIMTAGNLLSDTPRFSKRKHIIIMSSDAGSESSLSCSQGHFSAGLHPGWNRELSSGQSGQPRPYPLYGTRKARLGL